MQISKEQIERLIQAERSLIKRLESTKPPEGKNEYGTDLSFFHWQDIRDAYWRLKHWQNHLEQINVGQ